WLNIARLQFSKQGQSLIGLTTSSITRDNCIIANYAWLFHFIKHSTRSIHVIALRIHIYESWAYVNIMIQSKFNSKTMQPHTFSQGLRTRTRLEKGRECVVIRKKTRAQEFTKKRKGKIGRIRASITPCHYVKQNNILVKNLIKQMVGMVHIRSCRVECAEINELGENRDITLKIGFNGICLNLLELVERCTFGQKRKRVELIYYELILGKGGAWFCESELASWNTGDCHFNTQ
ncbi:hypothetical protein Csa_023647, partial [Cucumis sativus]